MRKVLWPVAYVAAIVLANVLTEHFGLVPAGFGLMTTAGTYAAAFVIVSRNFTQDVIGKRMVLVLMGIGVILTWVLASPILAVASGVAFALSEAADMAVYTPLRNRGRSRAVALASGVGAVVDTFVFLWIAGFPLSAAPGQLVVKIGMGLLAALILWLVKGRRAVPSQPLRTRRH
jgi:uncharacterized PurR-regulated membrane protein YhhQ (DUF165 family)